MYASSKIINAISHIREGEQCKGQQIENKYQYGSRCTLLDISSKKHD